MTMGNEGMAEIQLLNGNGLSGTRFGAVAIGSDTTSPSASDSTLGSEHTTNGASRNSGGEVAVTQETSNFTDDTVRWDTTWNITGDVTVNELGVFNDSAANSGELLLRQTFSKPLELVADDTLTLTIDVSAVGDDNNVQSAAGNEAQVLTNEGLAEGNQLYGTGLGGTEFSHMALGSDDGTTTLVASGNSTLGSEFSGTGLARQSCDTIQRTTTNFTNDTLQFINQWSVSGTASIREVGVFNASGIDSGDMFLRHVFANDLNVVDTDTFKMTVDVINSG